MIRWSRISLTAAAACLAVLSALAQTISLELKNGDRITGQILSETNGRVTLSNSFASQMSIPLGEITRRVVIPPTNTPLIAVVATNAPVLATTNSPAVAAVSTNALTKSNAVTFAKAVAATNRFLDSPLLKNWHGDIQVGADLTFSERNRQVYNGRAKLIYAKNRFKTVIDYDTTYGRTEVDETVNGVVTTTTKTDANRMNGAIKTDFDLTKKWYVYNLAGMGYDEIRKIDLRYEIGPGVGYHLVQASNFFLNVESGITHQREQRADDTEQSRLFGRLAENGTWKITPRLTWDEKFEYLPSLEESGEYKMRFETNLRYAMLQNVFLSLSVLGIYDSQPALGIKKGDLQIRSSVGVKF
jgi:putative salt-induced outer membrane protein YdiY